MKNLMLICTILFSASVFAASPAPVSKYDHFLHNNSFEFEAVTLNTNLDKSSLSAVDFDFQATVETHFNKFAYGSVDVIKYDKSQFGYGALVGVQDSYKVFTPYSEVYYSHNYSDSKNISDSQFNYDSGVKFNCFESLTPYLELDNYADNDRKFIKTGVKYNVNKRYYVVVDYAFPSKVSSNKLGLGAGIQF